MFTYNFEVFSRSAATYCTFSMQFVFKRSKSTSNWCKLKTRIFLQAGLDSILGSLSKKCGSFRQYIQALCKKSLWCIRTHSNAICYIADAFAIMWYIYINSAGQRLCWHRANCAYRFLTTWKVCQLESGNVLDQIVLKMQVATFSRLSL